MSSLCLLTSTSIIHYHIIFHTVITKHTGLMEQSQSKSTHHRHNEEDTKSSSEEDGTEDHLKEDLQGTGLSYECVFCKRGFTTAQALGGHMNIHRKERTNKTRPSSVAARKAAEANATSDLMMRSQRSLQGYPSPHFVTDSEVNASYRMYIPAGHEYYPARHHPYLLATDADCHCWQSGSALSLKIGTSSANEDENNDHSKEEIERSSDACTNKGDGLDLELRLGNDP